MSLRTCDRKDLKGIENGDDVPMFPGSIVCHADHCKSSCGVIIAVDEHHALVLWSKEPSINPVFLRDFKALFPRIDYASFGCNLVQVEPIPPSVQHICDKDIK